MTEWAQTVEISMSETEAALTTTGKGGPGSFWAEVVQRLIDEGADIEFFYDLTEQCMDFTLRNTDRLVYDWDLAQSTLAFRWQRRADGQPMPLMQQGLWKGDRLCSIDFIQGGAMERERRRLHVEKTRPPATTMFSPIA